MGYKCAQIVGSNCSFSPFRLQVIIKEHLDKTVSPREEYVGILTELTETVDGTLDAPHTSLTDFLTLDKNFWLCLTHH